MYELSVEQIDFVSGADEKSYKIGYEVGKAMGEALKYASLGVLLIGLAAASA